MTALSLWDHLFAVIVFLIYPAYSWFTIKKTLVDIKAGGESAKISAYKEVIGTWIMFAIVVVALWVWQQRGFTDLGFRDPDIIRSAIGALASIAFIAMVIIPIRKMSLSSDGPEVFAKQIGDLGVILPQTKKEESWFKWVSTNAGITEELIFRGHHSGISCRDGSVCLHRFVARADAISYFSGRVAGPLHRPHSP